MSPEHAKEIWAVIKNWPRRDQVRAIYDLAEEGYCTVSNFAKAVGISERTLYTHRRRYGR